MKKFEKKNIESMMLMKVMLLKNQLDKASRMPYSEKGLVNLDEIEKITNEMYELLIFRR